MRVLKVLIACEESQRTCIEFRKLGHEAYSNDIQDCSGGHPEWHLKMDAFEALKLKDWDLIIAHPPCTHLAVSGASSFAEKIKDGRQQEAIDFFMGFTKTKIPFAIENPICIMSSKYRKPDQIIQPFWFGDPVPKKTCLWLQGLPRLAPENIVEPEFLIYKSSKNKSGVSKYSVFGKLGKGKGKERSKTFPGIARAFAQQWSLYLTDRETYDLLY